jgi:CRISPR-associated endoribonuclease Cas6
VPSRWRVPLRGPTAPQVPVEAPHAVVSRWLDDDHKAAVKPYALAPPWSAGHRTVLAVRLLDDALAARLTARAVAGGHVRLGRHQFTVAARPELDLCRPWAELAAAGRRRAWEVAFLSPTTFRRGVRTSPWPAPESVLTSLISRWKALHPSSAPTLDQRAMRSVWVSDVEGRSEALRLWDTVVSGFIGRVRYVCDGSDAEAAAVDALLALAPFAGIGSHTAFGLGTVGVSSTWQPGRTNAPAGVAGSRPG